MQWALLRRQLWKSLMAHIRHLLCSIPIWTKIEFRYGPKLCYYPYHMNQRTQSIRCVIVTQYQIQGELISLFRTKMRFMPHTTVWWVLFIKTRSLEDVRLCFNAAGKITDVESWRVHFVIPRHGRLKMAEIFGRKYEQAVNGVQSFEIDNLQKCWRWERRWWRCKLPVLLDYMDGLWRAAIHVP